MKHLNLRNILIAILAIQLLGIFGLYFTSKRGDKSLEQVTSIVEKRFTDAGIKFKKAKVSLGKIPSGLAGVTIGIPYIFVYIVLDEDYFYNASNEVREALVLHEYTHYLGVSKHTNGYMNDIEWIFKKTPLGGFYLWRKCPISIMHESDEVNTCFYKYKEYYYKDAIKQIVDTNNQLM